MIKEQSQRICSRNLLHKVSVSNNNWITKFLPQKFTKSTIIVKFLITKVWHYTVLRPYSIGSNIGRFSVFPDLIVQTGWVIGPESLLKPIIICQNNTNYTHITPIQEAIAVGIEHQLKCFGKPDSYLVETVQTLKKKRDEIVGVLKECGLTPIVPEAGYFVIADTSSIGKKFESSDEPYDFQFAKWLMREKVRLVYHNNYYRQLHLNTV